MPSREAGKLAFVNARLIDPASELDGPGDLLVEAGRILDFGPRIFDGRPPEDAELIDCAGACLAPGLVDMRVQLREPGEEHKETISTASRAAAAGGVTSMVALPNTHPVMDDVSGVEFVARRAREEKLVKVYTYGAVTRGLEGTEMTELGLLAEYGAVAFTDSPRAIAGAQMLMRALSYARTFDLTIVQHPHEPSLSTGAMHEGELATRLGLPGIPAAAEAIMLERDLRLVELTGGRYHAANISTAAGVEIMKRAKARGMPVTCSTAPQYFTLNENAVGDYRTFAKVFPPLRSEEDRQAVTDGLSDGTIDAIASDHSPHDQDSKRQPFAQAAFGIVGLETLLALSLSLAHGGSMTISKVLAAMTCHPAEILSLSSGRLERGAAADLLIFDCERPWQIDTSAFHSKSKNSPFDGHPVQGRAIMTVVDGRVIHRS